MSTDQFRPSPRQLAHLRRIMRLDLLGCDLAVHGGDDQLHAEAVRYVAARRLAEVNELARVSLPSCPCGTCNRIHRAHKLNVN